MINTTKNKNKNTNSLNNNINNNSNPNAHNMLKIVQLNIKSIRSSKDLLEQYIIDNNIDFILLQQHWLVPEEKIKIKNFNISKYSRTEGYAGVAILSKNIFKFNTNSIVDFLPMEVVEVNTLNLEKT